ncbi:MAG: hypothetical protein ACO3K7_02470 [Candidatus Marinamargulisbacteria bacterium]
MPKYIVWLCVLMCIACSKNYIDVDPVPEDTSLPIVIASTDVNVDFIELTLRYDRPEDIQRIELRRDTTEPARTIYDGAPVWLDSGFETNFMDYKTNSDQPSLSPNTTYHYTLFYQPSEDHLPMQYVTGQTLQTLSYKAGMQRSLLNWVTAIKAKSSNTKILLSTSHLDIFVDNTNTIIVPDLWSEIDGTIIDAFQYKPTNISQDSNQMEANTQRLDAINKKPLLGVDYVTEQNKVTKSKNSFNTHNIIGLTRPGNLANLSDVSDFDITGDTNADAVESLTDVKTFLLWDAPISSSMIQTLGATNHDLIIISPFSDTHGYVSLQEVAALKTKPEGEDRLVYAYISVGTLAQNIPLWDTAWNTEASRPNWVGIESNNNYLVKYWRPQWNHHVIELITQVIDLGFDGIVLGGVGEYHSHSAGD